MFARMRPCISVAAIGMVCVVSTESCVTTGHNFEIGDEQKNLRICKDMESNVRRVR